MIENFIDNFIFKAFATGSSGNCYYIGTNKSGMLIDTGIGVRTIKKNLKEMGLEFSNLWAILITHDHTDHILSVGNIAEQYNIPVYATKLVHEGIARNYRVTKKLSSANIRLITSNDSFTISNFNISTFPVSHDASECVGYSIELNGKKISIATDLGYISAEVGEALYNSDHLIVEANYDEHALENGRYPQLLKERIRGEKGHLNNLQMANFVADNYNPKWQNIFLCHMSKDNNSKELIEMCIDKQLKQKEVKLSPNTKFIVLERTTPSLLYTL